MKRLLLAGAGHAHAVVLEGLARKPLHGLRATLVSPDEREIYTGMFPGILAGHYPVAEAQIDFARLAERASVEFVRGALATLDAPARKARLADGRELAYDIASLDVGSIAAAGFPGAREHAIPIKPFRLFMDAWGRHDARHVGIIGGGAAGAEVAMALRHRGAQVTVYSERSSLVPALQARLGAALRRRGVSHIALSVSALESGPVVVTGSARASYDAVVLATGPSPWPWLRATGLALDERGFVLVDSLLRSVSHPEVHAVGDCATLQGAAHPRSGVYAVRHGEALLHNLRASLENRPARPYVPQRRALSLVSCGDRYAIAERGGLTLEGRWVWRWKDHIDRRWVRRFADPH